MTQDTPPQNAPVLPPRRKHGTGVIVGLSLAAVAVIAAAAAIIPNLPSSSEAAVVEGAGTPVTVSIGATDASQPHWKVLGDLLAEEDITLEVVNFTDYPLPNPALAGGETGLNGFRHLDYLSNHNIATGDDLQPIGSTMILPLPLYSDKWDSVEEIPDGAQIAIPNDPSNQARALFVLEAAGLLTLTGDETVPTPDDIDADKSTVTVISVEASQTPAALQTADGAIINNNFSRDAGLDPSSALFSVDPDDARSWPYLRVAELYHSAAVTDLVTEGSSNTAVVIDLDAEELRDRLASIEADKKAAEQ